MFFGSVTARITTSLLGVVAGGAFAQFIPTQVLKGLAAIGFATLAVRLLWHPPQGGDED